MNSTNTQTVADGWSTWSNTRSQDRFDVVTSPVLSGTKAQKMSSSGMPTGTAIWVLQDLIVEENKSFVVNGQFYVEAQHNSQVLLYIQFFDGSNHFLDSKVVSIPPGMYYSFMTLPLTGTIPAGAKRARIHAGIEANGAGGSGSVIVDTLSFRYDSDGNQLVNGGMEGSTTQISADGWGTWSNTGSQDHFEVAKSPVSSGSKAQRISSSGMPIGTVLWVLQDIKVEGNKSFMLSGQMYVERQQNTQVQLLIQFFDGSNHFLKSEFTNMPICVYNSYTNLSVTGIIPAGAKRARVHAGIKATGTGGSGSFLVDSLSYQTLPSVGQLKKTS